MKTFCLGLAVLVWLASGVAQADDRLVFGSFQNATNAENWASRMRVLLNVAVEVVEGRTDADNTTYRVVTAPLAGEEASRVRRVADNRQLKYWRLLDVESPVAEAAAVERPTRALPPPVRAGNPQRRPNDQPPAWELLSDAGYCRDLMQAAGAEQRDEERLR